MDDDLSLEEELLLAAGRVGGRRGAARRAASDSDDEVSEDERPQRKRARPSRPPPSSAPDSDGGDSDDEGGYGSDLYEDEDDRQRLEAMNELEREMELADRAERRDRERERRRHMKMVQQGQPEGAGVRAGGEADTMRSSSRLKKQDTAKRSAAQELRAARELREKKTAQARQKESRPASSGWSEDESLSVSEDGDEYRGASSPSSLGGDGVPDEGLEDEVRGTTEPYRRDRREYADSDEEDRYQEIEEAEEAGYEDVRSIQVRRYKLEQWVNEPFLEETLAGCFVKLAAGEKVDAEGRPQRVYLLGRVVHVETREPGIYKDSGRPWNCPYVFGPEGSGNKTHKFLVVSRGTSRRTFPMSLVSNAHLDESEFLGYLKHCSQSNLEPLIKMDVEVVRDKLKKADNYQYTADDVKKILLEKRQRGNVGANLASEKARIIHQRDAAIETNNIDEAERLTEQLADIEARIMQAMDAKRRGAGSMAGINKRNAERNFQNSLNNVGSRPDGRAAGDKEAVDIFSRRMARPMLYWNTKGAGVTEDGVQAANDQPGTAYLAHSVDLPEVRVLNKAQDSLADFHIDVDVSLVSEAQRTSRHVRSLLGRVWTTALSDAAVPPDLEQKRMLTLMDYKRRQGIA